MKLITETALVQMLGTFTGASFVTVVTKTAPDMNKKHRETKEPNPYLGKISRMAERFGHLGVNYENAVNNQREREAVAREGTELDDGTPVPEFRAEGMWNGKGEHVDGSKCLLRHVDTRKLYMVFYPAKSSVKEDVWTCDGVEISVELLKAYLPPVRTDSGRQGTEKIVPWRVVAIENVVQLKLGGEVYMVSHG